MKKFLANCFITLLAVMTLFCLLMAWSSAENVIEQRRWHRTEGTVTDQRAVIHERRGGKPRRIFYCAEIATRHFVSMSMKHYESSITKCYPAPLQRDFVARLAQEEFAPGSRVTLFYDPYDPATVTSQRARLGGEFYYALLLAMMFGGLALTMVYRFHARKSPQAEG